MLIRKKPIVLEAFVLPYKSFSFLSTPDWVFNAYEKGVLKIDFDSFLLDTTFSVETLEGTMYGHDSDVLVKGVDGELYIIKREVFDKTYDVVEPVQD